MKKEKKTGLSKLRQEAEDLLKSGSVILNSQLAESDTLKLLHELQVQQIELEMQNEELSRANKRAEVAANKYLELYDFAPAGYLSLSKEGRIIELNLRLAQMLGIERSMFINKLFKFFLAADSKPIFNLFLAKAFSSKTRETCEARLTPADSLPIDVLLTGILSENEEQCFVTAVDITAQKRMENESRASEEKYRLIAENSSDAILIFGADNKVQYFSPVYYDQLGYDRTDEINLNADTIYFIIHPDDRDIIFREIFNAIELKKSELIYYYRAKHTAGHYIWREDHAKLNYDSSGNYEGAYVICRDITERKLAETSLQEALDRLQKIAGRVPGVVYQYKLRPDGSSCFPFASDGIRDIYRVSPDEVREDASKVFAALHPDDYDGVAASIYASAKELTPWQYEYRVKFDDGAIRTVYGNAIPQKEEDGSVLWHGFISDITERKQMENALQDAHKSLTDILEAAINTAIISTDIHGIIKVFSRGAEKMLGYSAEELVGKKTPACFHLESEIVEHGIELSKELGCTIEGFDVLVTKARMQDRDERIWTYLCKNGTVIKVNLTVTSIRNNKGDIIGFLGIANNITKRVQAEIALRESEEKLRGIIEQSMDGIVITDGEGFVSIWNIAMENMTGLKKSEVIGLPIWEVQFRMILREFKTPELLEHLQTATKTLLRNTDTWAGQTMEHKIMYPDGSIKIVQDSTFSILIGSTCMLGSIMRDITAHKQEEVALQEALDRIQKIASSVPGIVYQFRLDPDGSTCFPYLSDGIKDVLRLTPDEVYQDSSLIFANVHPDDFAGLKEAIYTSAKDISPWQCEFRVKIADGTFRFLSGNALPQREENGAVLWHGYIYDITARKQAEKALRENEEIFDQFLKHSPIYIFFQDENVRSLKLSQNYEQLFNMPLTDIIGKNMYDLFPSELAKSIVEDSQRVMQGKQIITAEEEFNGRCYTTTKFPINVEGRTHFLAGFTIDITERRQAENIIRLNEERYKALIRTSIDGFYVVDMTGRFIEVNEVYCSMTGYTEEELLTMKVSDLESVESLEETNVHINNIIMKGSDRFESKHWCSDGSKIDVEVKVVALPDNKIILSFIQDITAKKLAEKILKEAAEEKYRIVADFAYDWEYWQGTDGSFKYMSPSVEKVTGYKADEFFHNPNLINQIVYPDDLDIWTYYKEKIDLYADDVTPLKIEFRIIKKNGHTRWMQQVGRNIINGRGENLGVRVTARNITKSKAAEDEIRKLSTAVEQSQVSVVITDLLGRIEYVNHKCCEVSGYDKKELIGSTPKIFQSGLTPKGKYADLWNTILRGEVWIADMINKKKTGELFWESTIISPIFDSANRLKSFVSMREDITDRKQKEKELQEHRERLEEIVELRTKELRQSEEKFKALAENSDDLIMRMDRDLICIYANPTAAKEAGINTERLIGISFPDLVLPMEISLFLTSALIKVFETREKNRIEFQLPGGKWTDWILIPEMEENGDVKTIIASGRDITRIKDSEKEIYKSLQKAKELNEFKSNFISTASHEFRTPLSSILLSAQLIQRYAGKWTKEQINEHYERIKASVSNLTGILDDVLAANKNESKKINKEKLNIENELNSIISEIKPLLTEEHSFEFSFGCKEKYYYFDNKSLKLVFNNLLSNAIKYSPNGGRIHLLVLESDKDIIFEVSDEGMGLEENELLNIFEPFYRARKSEHIKGTGLGLPIVKQEVEQYNGKIEVNSTLGKGTTFTIKIPLAEIVK